MIYAIFNMCYIILYIILLIEKERENQEMGSEILIKFPKITVYEWKIWGIQTWGIPKCVELTG